MAEMDIARMCPGMEIACVENLINDNIIAKLPAHIAMRAVFLAKIGPFVRRPELPNTSDE